MSDPHFQSDTTNPYEPLGLQLRKMRERHHESLAEVSGAVEIEVDDLERIEAGHDRPSEDILLLLINHFDVQDQEAIQLWEMAGYEEPPVERSAHDGTSANRGPAVMIVAVDVRTMYSDDVQIKCGDAGLVVQFTQEGHNGQAVPISRIGMSYEQAEKVIQQLQSSVLKAKYLRGPKGLPQPGDRS